ncbi:alpha-mannosidase [Shouchella miscanthi]|uniref:Alpha-mannosidase n=2 Tax=Shouchella miscanthi TaxID=2598861 RepID=A0ABU6NPM5_9BACI|nr:alpha-mannosidase [Shouchella miscanthi]
MQRLRRCLNQMQEWINHDRIDIKEWVGKRSYYKNPGEYEQMDEEPYAIQVGDRLIESGETLIIEKELLVPEVFIDAEIDFVFNVGQHGVKTNHEGLVYLDGVPYHGIDRNRHEFPLPKRANGQPSYRIKIELFNPTAQVIDPLNRQNEPAEYAPAPLYLLESAFVRKNKGLEKLYYTMKVYLEAAMLLPESDLNRIKIVNELTLVKKWLMNTEVATLMKESALVNEKEAALSHALTEIDVKNRGSLHMVGQSHIDLAWLWPMKEAVRKTSRTFSTMSTLLDRYDHFRYAQSQPQAYAFVKAHYPELYKRVKQHIRSGRWEVVGGMWVEPDLNIPSGESLVRQLLYGMTFYKEEFGKQPRIEWLPDTFGYCASLPQLLKKAGLDYFMTTKMNWNDTNPFPYDLFNWVGIDGTSILSYVNHGVNEHTHPKEIAEHWGSYKQKAVHPEQMLLYGHGDGGGGVTKEMLEYVERSASLPGLPATSYSTAHQFFDRVVDANPVLPTWVGDLYLELHRGTYTTHAQVKRWNRKAEVLYRDAEIWSSLLNFQTSKWEVTSLDAGWKLLLFNQFHDIIPGTSIPEVYERAEADYKELMCIGKDVKQLALQSLAQEIETERMGQPLVVFNSLSWERSEVVKLVGKEELLKLDVVDENDQSLKSDCFIEEDGQVNRLIYVPAIPQMGYRTIWLRPEKQKMKAIQEQPFIWKWETDFYQIEWNANGEMTRLYDKKACREVLKQGECGNQFQLFHDQPTYWDAWDIDPLFAEQEAYRPELLSVDVVLKGKTMDRIRFKWNISNSFIEQDLVLYHHSGRLDFETKVSWHENHKLLKVAFPVHVQTSKATFEIPFGVVERATHSNTSWEKAQFEVCGHRFADVSEGNYGVSLLNDCKYGYDVKGSQLRLSLLRAPKWPDPNADQGNHLFTYSLLPHQGTWNSANVVRSGYELNHSVTSIQVDAHKGTLPARHSFIELNATHAILDTVKRSEKDEGVTMRFYESSGGQEAMEVKLSQTAFQQATETNLLETPLAPLSMEAGVLRTTIKPFEVKTITFSNK